MNETSPIDTLLRKLPPKQREAVMIAREKCQSLVKRDYTERIELATDGKIRLVYSS